MAQNHAYLQSFQKVTYVIHIKSIPSLRTVFYQVSSVVL